MDRVQNPYDPGTGAAPPGFAARDDLLDRIPISLERCRLKLWYRKEGMSAELKARFISWDPSPVGPQAYLALIEPNGDEQIVRCLVKAGGTDICGQDDRLRYLNERYTERVVCLAARNCVLEQPFVGL